MRCVLLAVLGMLAFGAPARAETLRVPDDFPTIQAAIDAATDGDEVLLAPGEYGGVGNLRVVISGIDLAVRSESGPELTRIVGDAPNGEEWALAVQPGVGNTVTIQGIGFHSLAGRFGSGIAATGAGRIEVERCRFVECESPLSNGPDFGGAVRVAGTVAANFRDCEFLRNRAARGGAGISIESSGRVVLENCSLLDNSSGGVWLGASAADVAMTDCNLSDNGGEGAIASAPGSYVDVSRSLFVNNTGVRVYSASFRSSTITRNFVAFLDGPGGALQIYSGPVSLDRCIVRGNCTISGVTDLLAYGPVTITCCALDSSGIAGWEHLSFLGDQVWEDPNFCDPEPCGFASGDSPDRYHLDSESPCSAWMSPCGETIGALDVGCGGAVGACCLGTECSLTTSAGCADLGGSYLGDDHPCELGACDPTPVAKKSWGEIKRLFR